MRSIWEAVVPSWADRNLRVILAARVGMSLGRAIASVVTALYLAAIGFSAIEIGVLFVGVAVIGFALGIVETLEPTAMSVLRTGDRAGRAMGSLSSARSVGAFVGNLAMGLLYGFGAAFAYGYAATVAGAAGLIVLTAVPALRRWARRPSST
jgi:hypothetical protein